MREGVKKVRAAGGHIGFYYNAWTFDATIPEPLLKYKAQIPPDVKLPDWWKEFRAYASVYPDGSREAGNYLDGYSGMCVGAAVQELIGWIRLFNSMSHLRSQRLTTGEDSRVSNSALESAYLSWLKRLTASIFTMRDFLR